MVKRLLQLTRPGAFEIVELPSEPPGRGQVTVAVEATTTCPQWDMHLWRGEPMFPDRALSYPFTAGAPGHEMVGRVIAVGDGVTHLHEGQRVAAWRALSMDRHGTYATEVNHDESRLLPIPDGPPTEAWAPLELAMCVCALLRDLSEHGFLPCERFGVCGLGPGGLIAAQVARAMGVRQVLGFDSLESRRHFARRQGWCDAIDPASHDRPSHRGGHDAMDVSIDCVGSAAVVDFLGPRTKHVLALFGVQREDYTFKRDYFGGPPLRMWGYPDHNLPAARFAHALILAGKLNLAPLATHRVPLRDYSRAVQLLLDREAIKVCLLCDRANT